VEKIYLVENGKTIGTCTLLDAEPNMDVLHAAFPDAAAIIHDRRRDAWFVDLGDAPAPLLAD
jgi:hypothetical protein